MAAGASRLPAAKYTRSLEISPRSTTSAPSEVTPSANAADRAAPDARMSRPIRMRGAPVNRANATPTDRATDASSWSGTMPRMSYALKIAAIAIGLPM